MNIQNKPKETSTIKAKHRVIVQTYELNDYQTFPISYVIFNEREEVVATGYVDSFEFLAKILSQDLSE